MSITGTGYVQRELFKVFMDVGESSTAEWEVIGDKIEEMSLEMNPNVETVTDILGITSTTLDKYEVQTSVSPFRAKKESKIFATLYDIVKEQKTLSDVEKTFLCVNLFDAAGSDGNTAYSAWTQRGIVAVQSYGGGTTGLDIPFNVHWIGTRTHGTVSISSNGAVSFTPS